MSSPKRAIPSVMTYRRLSEFYGGLGCVATGSPAAGASLHHLNGDPSYSEFPNLIPLALDLHNGLVLGRTSLNSLRAELRLANLKTTAERYFQSGRLTSAYACMRLAFSVYRHFLRPADRDPDVELQTVAHCLYHLRRCIGQAPLESICECLSHLLTRELQPCLTAPIPFAAGFSLLVELGSWLNENAWFDSGLRLLMEAEKRLRHVRDCLRRQDIARFERQLANGFVQVGRYSTDLHKAMQAAIEYDSSINSRFGMYNTRLNLHMSEDQPKKALDVLHEEIHCFEKQTDYFFAPFAADGPTIMTGLAYIYLSIICEGRSVQSGVQRRRLLDRLKALMKQERYYGRVTTVNRVPGLVPAVREATARMPELAQFLEERMFPVLPLDAAELIERVAARL